MNLHRKRLYDAAVRLCAEMPTDVDHHQQTRCYSDGNLIVTHYLISGNVIVETSEADSGIEVYRVERGRDVTRYLGGAWEARLLQLAANAWRA